MQSLSSPSLRAVDINLLDILTVIKVLVFDFKNTKCGVSVIGIINGHQFSSFSVVIDIFFVSTLAFFLLVIQIYLAVETDPQRFLSWGWLGVVYADFEGIVGFANVESGASFLEIFVFIIMFGLLGDFLSFDVFGDHVFLIVDGFLLTWIDHDHVFTADLFLHGKLGLYLTDFFLEFFLLEFFLEIWLILFLCWIEKTV